MRKVSLILAVVLCAVPAWAALNVTITCVPTGEDVLVSYNNGYATKIRAFALDITVTNGTISVVNDNMSYWYTIYPGSIVIEDNNVVKDGNAVVDPCDLPSDTKGGIGTSGITVEMGALYSPPDDAHGPNNADPLLRFTVTPVNPDANSVITIVENSSRGGVVMTDPNLDPTVVAPGCTIVRVQKCYAGMPDYQTWVDVCEPPCWCYLRQCHGDAENTKEYIKGKGYYYVHFKDLSVLTGAWNVREPPEGPGLKAPGLGICADFKHDKEYIKGKGYYRVHFKDLSVLTTYWNVREAPEGPGIPSNCLVH